jgi:hypothetical protein
VTFFLPLKFAIEPSLPQLCFVTVPALHHSRDFALASINARFGSIGGQKTDEWELPQRSMAVDREHLKWADTRRSAAAL